MRSEVAERREKIVAQIRKKNRDEMIKGIREAAVRKQQISEQPLVSDVFADYLDFNHWQLTQQSESLEEIIANTDASQLSSDQHYYFIQDLFYLVTEEIIKLPYSTKFKKDESGYTANLVAVASEQLSDGELVYWIDYMDEEAKEILFLSINVEEESHGRWVNDKQLYRLLLDHAKWMEAAASTFKQILVNSMEISKKNIDESVQIIRDGIVRQIEGKNRGLFMILAQIWMNFVKIYCKLQPQTSKTKQMIVILKNILKRHNDILLQDPILQQLNQLYDLVRQDFLEDDRACEIILIKYLQDAGSKYQWMVTQSDKLHRNYIYRLFLSNWRMKKLYNKQFEYSPDFFKNLVVSNRSDDSDPLFKKLMNLNPYQV